MNIDALEVGKTYKNFRELSACLGYDVPPAGNSKKSVLKEIERFYELTRQDNSITVTSRRDQPLPQIRKQGNHVKYTELLQEILRLYAMSKKKYGRTWTISQTRLNWMLTLGIIPRNIYDLLNYRTQSKTESKLASDYGFDTENIYAFTVKTKQRTYGILQSFLRSQTYEERYKINNRFAKKEEVQYIQQKEQELLEEYRVKSPMHLSLSKQKKFYDELSDRIYEEKNWTSYYKVIRLTVEGLPLEPLTEEEKQQVYQKMQTLKAQLLEVVRENLIEKLPEDVIKDKQRFQRKMQEQQSRMAVGTFSGIGLYTLPYDYVEEQTKILMKYYV